MPQLSLGHAKHRYPRSCASYLDITCLRAQWLEAISKGALVDVPAGGTEKRTHLGPVEGYSLRYYACLGLCQFRG